MSSIARLILAISWFLCAKTSRNLASLAWSFLNIFSIYDKKEQPFHGMHEKHSEKEKNLQQPLRVFVALVTFHAFDHFLRGNCKID